MTTWHAWTPTLEAAVTSAPEGQYTTIGRSVSFTLAAHIKPHTTVTWASLPLSRMASELEHVSAVLVSKDKHPTTRICQVWLDADRVFIAFEAVLLGEFLLHVTGQYLTESAVPSVASRLRALADELDRP